MKKLFSTVIVLSLVLFVACSKVNTETEISTEVNSETILEDQVYLQAVGTSSPNLCDQIQNTKRKDECKNTVTSNQLLKAAMQSLNSDNCKKIKLESYKNSCKQMVEESLKARESQTKQAEYFNEQNQKSNEIVAENNLEACDDLELDNFKLTCRSNIIFNQVQATGNTDLCGKIGHEDLEKDCKDLVN